MDLIDALWCNLIYQVDQRRESQASILGDQSEKQAIIDARNIQAYTGPIEYVYTGYTGYHFAGTGYTTSAINALRLEEPRLTGYQSSASSYYGYSGLNHNFDKKK